MIGCDGSSGVIVIEGVIRHNGGRWDDGVEVGSRHDRVGVMFCRCLNQL